MPLDATTPQSGKNLPHIAPVDTMVIDFWHKKQLVALCNGFPKLVLKRPDGPSTQLIEATSCVEMLNTKIGAEELRNLLAIKC
jgi:hypothetical protein